MPSRSTSTRRDSRTGERSTLVEAPGTPYGGPVGDMLLDIEQHIADCNLPVREPAPVRADLVHRLSVGLGYIGLAAGFGAAGLLMAWAI